VPTVNEIFNAKNLNLLNKIMINLIFKKKFKRVSIGIAGKNINNYINN